MSATFIDQLKKIKEEWRIYERKVPPRPEPSIQTLQKAERDYIDDLRKIKEARLMCDCFEGKISREEFRELIKSERVR